MRSLDPSPLPPLLGRGSRRCQGLALVILGLVLAACQRSSMEIPQARAKPGDLLVRVDEISVKLEKTFRPGEPNALFDGVVRLESQGIGMPALMEINAICSMPGEPGWPSYDNLYGRPLRRVEEAKGRTGDTQWQVLYNYSGRQDVRMGKKPGPWIDRLRENLCRRGNFDDRPQKTDAKRGAR